VAPGHLAGWWGVLNASAVEAIRATYPELLIAGSRHPVDGRRPTRQDARAAALAGWRPPGLLRALVADRPRE